MFIQFSGKCEQKHEIMDKNMTLWTKISNLLMNIKVNFIQFSRKCGQKHEIMDKNMKLWTKISSLLMNI
jgi:hypothetical protein